jgi:hypothetical protein
LLVVQRESKQGEKNSGFQQPLKQPEQAFHEWTSEAGTILKGQTKEPVIRSKTATQA